ncbi:MAG: GrpB family protein [Pseudomonadota bacterium]
MTAFVEPHTPRWSEDFRREKAEILNALGDHQIALHHIGSTAVPALLAKPIIDLLGETSDLRAFDAIAVVLESLRYQAMGAYGIEGRRFFRKFDREGRRSHHLHVFERGSPHIERHLAFRDYLIAHPEAASAYGALKADLTRGAGVTWEQYIAGKDSFVRLTEASALKWARSRAK